MKNTNNNTNNNGKINVTVDAKLCNTWGYNPEWAELSLTFEKKKDELRLIRVVDNNQTQKNWRPVILTDAVLAAYMWLSDHGYDDLVLPRTRFEAKVSSVPARHGKHPTWGVWLGENPIKQYRKSQCVDSARWLMSVHHLNAILRCRAQELVQEGPRENPFEGAFEVSMA